MRKILLSLTAAASVVLAASPAMAAPQEREETQGVGLYVSNIAGSGFTYWRQIGGGFGFHVSGIGWGQGASSFFNVGGAVTKEFDRREWGSLYGLLAVGTGVGSFLGGSGLSSSLDLQTNITPGVGVTMGPIFLEAGYSVYRNSGGVGFVPAGGAGLLWKF